MSINNYILNLLNIKDENIYILTNNCCVTIDVKHFCTKKVIQVV